MDIDHLAKELAKIRAVLTARSRRHASAKTALEQGMTLVTRSVVDPVRGGFEEEFEELCPTCEGEGI